VRRRALHPAADDPLADGELPDRSVTVGGFGDDRPM